MYASLDSIDLIATGPRGRLLVLTDHRSRDEIDASPEVSTLFALARILRAQDYARRGDEPTEAVVYACADWPPAPLLAAIAATGARLDVDAVRTQPTPAADAVTLDELIDQAFHQLALRVCARAGMSDQAMVLRALEAETAAAPPVIGDDPAAYWTRLLELSALGGECLRARLGGRWVVAEATDLPFGFAIDDGMVLPTNRASRFLQDGAGESMFLLLSAIFDRDEASTGTLLPSLRDRAGAVADKLLFRALLDPQDGDAVDPALPVIAYGHDRPQSFSLLTVRSRQHDVDALHGEALSNLGAVEVEVLRGDADGTDLIVVTNSFHAAEKLLDVEFMLHLHGELGPRLAAAVPRRGLMLVTSAAPAGLERALALLGRLVAQEVSTSRAISSAIMLVEAGQVVGRIHELPMAS